jgi:hypothetical protein
VLTVVHGATSSGRSSSILIPRARGSVRGREARVQSHRSPPLGLGTKRLALGEHTEGLAHQIGERLGVEPGAERRDGVVGLGPTVPHAGERTQKQLGVARLVVSSAM